MYMKRPSGETATESGFWTGIVPVTASVPSAATEATTTPSTFESGM